MNKLTKAVLGATLASASLTATAGAMLLPDGLSLEPLTGQDPSQGEGVWNQSFKFVQWWEVNGTPVSLSTLTPANASDFVLSGYGEFELANDVGNLECAGCEITFSFDGLKIAFEPLTAQQRLEFFALQAGSYIIAGSPLGPATEATVLAWAASEGLLIDLGGGAYAAAGLNIDDASLGIYVDYNPNLSVNAAANASNQSMAEDGSEWLTLDFQEVIFSVAPQDLADGVFGLSNGDATFGLVATGGTALANFQQGDDLTWVDEGIQQLSDVIGFGLSGTFSNVGGTYEVYSSIGGAGTATGNVVSAPATLGVLGLAMLGMGAFARRRKA